MNLKNANSTILSLLVLFVVSESCLAKPKQAKLWEKVEIELQSEKDYPNPYTDVDVWVNLKGPGFDKRCYGFWDGGRTWRIRVMATNTGQWTWESGSNQADTGLNNKTGAFVATDWTEAEKVENPLRRGMIKADAKGHSFEYADGTPMFWLADTWWSCMTKRYFWYEDDTPRKVGTPKAGFKDYVHYRKKQGYNGCMVIAAFPNWLTDKHGWTGGNWEDEKGNWSFVVEGNEPDLDRLNPRYFQSMDNKVDYLNAHGFIPFIETSRRDIAEYWKANYQWPDSYARYIRYICFRYQGHIIINSPIHLDNWKYGLSKEDWNQAANTLMDNYDWPPFGHMASANPPGSTLKAFGHTDEARWLSFHGVGNTSRDHFLFRFVPEIFHLANPVPVVVNEPYYDGLQWGNKAEQGSDLAAYYSRVALYGSVLSGALAGHVYGAHHIWRGDEQMPEAFVIQSAAQMQHIRGFLFSEGDTYRNLVEARDLLQPHETPNDDKNMGWSYCMKNAAKDLFLLYFEAGCQKARLSGVQPEKEYKLDWFDPRDGKWVKSQNVTSDKNGYLVLPEFPGNESVSKADWALKLKLAEGTSQKPVLGADDNLMAWAFLAFDPEGRSADERAQMLKGLNNGDLPLPHIDKIDIRIIPPVNYLIPA